MEEISKYLCLLLRHKPELAELDMDEHGWVSVDQLISGVNKSGKFSLVMTKALLERIVADDLKQRYVFDDKHERIKCCQGHSISWVKPALDYREPPEYLYHGTTTKAFVKILESGSINKMKRHTVHLSANKTMAWLSAERWHETPVVLVINAKEMTKNGYRFGVAENGVWCTDEVPVSYICAEFYNLDKMLPF